MMQMMQSATGLFSLTFQLGGTLGIAIVITLLDHRITIISQQASVVAFDYAFAAIAADQRAGGPKV